MYQESVYPHFPFLQDENCSSWTLLSCAESVGLRSKLWRRVEELRSDSFSAGVPCEFLCPITRELMREPVIAAGTV